MIEETRSVGRPDGDMGALADLDREPGEATWGVRHDGDDCEAAEARYMASPQRAAVSDASRPAITHGRVAMVEVIAEPPT